MNVVTFSRLERANLAVTDELWKLGFYDERLQQVDVCLGLVHGAYGWQSYGGSGDIYIPAISLSKLGDLLDGSYTSLRDVLRHEYGHALADTHRGLIRSSKFKAAFGASHSWDFSLEYDPECHVTSYAADSPAEDFAEVFMLYVKCKGSLPKRLNTSAIRKKWQFIQKLRGAIAAGSRKW